MREEIKNKIEDRNFELAELENLSKAVNEKNQMNYVRREKYKSNQEDLKLSMLYHMEKYGFWVLGMSHKIRKARRVLV